MRLYRNLADLHNFSSKMQLIRLMQKPLTPGQ
jgi:hypothetical protein